MQVAPKAARPSGADRRRPTRPPRERGPVPTRALKCGRFFSWLDTPLGAWHGIQAAVVSGHGADVRWRQLERNAVHQTHGIVLARPGLPSLQLRDDVSGGLTCDLRESRTHAQALGPMALGAGGHALVPVAALGEGFTGDEGFGV